MARTAGSKNTKPKTHRLIVDLIAELPRPGPGVVWPVAGRAAWLELMERIFDVVYGGHPTMDDMPPNRRANGHAIPAKPEDHAFYIDREGFARMAGGERINATEVDGTLFDQRGEGDLGAIVWADGSKGVIGKVLDVRPA